MLNYCFKATKHPEGHKIIKEKIPEFIYFNNKVLKFNREKTFYCDKYGTPVVSIKQYISNFVSNNRERTVTKYGKKDLDITMLLKKGTVFNKEKETISYINGAEITLASILLNSESHK